MSWVVMCENCGEPFVHRRTPLKSGESIGEQMVRLATEAVNKYYFWCTACIADAPKI